MIFEFIRKHRFHKYQSVRNTGKHSYEECSVCGKRGIVDLMPGSGHQPIDRSWLEQANGINRHIIKKSRVLGYSKNQNYPYNVEIK